jgi:hypothetical protein
MQSERVFELSPSRNLGISLAIAFCILVIVSVSPALGQSADAAPERILYDETTHTFRMDSAGVSYVFGVNQNGEVQDPLLGTAPATCRSNPAGTRRCRDIGV